MSNNQIKILLVPSDLAGVGHYRNIWPGQEINKKFGNQFKIEIDHTPDFNNVEFFAQFDIVHFHRQLGPFEKQDNLIKELRNRGVVVVMDLDDYWMPSKDHPMYGAAVKERLAEKVTATFKMVDYVTTTTNIFANHIKKYNPNVQIIPNAIDMNHSMWTQEDTKKTDRVRISWIGGSCYDEKTEILTDGGFKLFNDLTGEEKIACLNPNTNQLEYHKANKHIKEPFVGKLQCGVNSLIDYAVTPNHKMYVSIPKSLTQKKLDFSLIKSEEVFKKDLHFKKDVVWEGQEKKFFTLPKLKIKENKLVLETGEEFEYSRNQKYSEDIEIDMDLWLKFFGFWLAEGWTSSTPKLYQVGVAQTKNNGYLEEIHDTLSKMGFNPTYTKDLKQVRVFDKRLWNYLNQFGKAEKKYIPNDILNLSSRQLNVLLQWFLNGDGSQEKSGYFFDKRYNELRHRNTSRRRAYTVSKKLADNIQEICLKTGVISSISNRGLRNSKMKDGRTVNGKHDAYVVNIGENSKRSRKTPLLRKENQFEENYNGYVYCVNVPHNIIYVRRNGKTMWCGNSHEKDLDLLRDSMNILHNDDSLKDKYQIIMCGYDVRGFITEVDQNGNVINNRKITPQETIWNKFEKIFTDDYNPKFITEEYKKYLLKCENTQFKGFDVYEGPYVRRWTLPLTQYGKHYNYCDVCLAPLAEHTFNEVKSELKIIEAGLTKKVLIAQEFGIYKDLLINNETGILIPKSKNIRGWYEAIKKVINDKDYRDRLANNLYDYVKDKYTLEIVTENRIKWYEKIVEKSRNKNQLVVESVVN